MRPTCDIELEISVLEMEKRDLLERLSCLEHRLIHRHNGECSDSDCDYETEDSSDEIINQ